MKRKTLRTIVALLLTAFVSVQPVTCPIQAATQKNTIKEKTTQSTPNPFDISDGSSDVTWPSGPKKKNLTSDSAILMNADSGLILYNKNMTKKHYPASITKILTTLLVAENCNLDETVTFTKSEVTNLEYGASNIETQVGEKLNIEQCLYGIMLASANEVCNGVADYVAGSIPAFADLMNKRANSLGCVNTHFSNPNGLHSDDHYTCAYDMALISRAAIQNPVFKKVAGTKSTYLNATNKHKARTLTNHHNMLYPYSTSNFLYDDCIGGKTGYTSVAQSTLVTFAQRDGMTLVCVVMKGTSSKTNLKHNIYTDTISLLEYGFNNYQVHELSNPSTTSSEETPFFTQFDSILDYENAPLQTSGNGKIILPNSVKSSSAVQKVVFSKNNKEEDGKHKIGDVTYTYGNKTVGDTTIYFEPDSIDNQLLTSDDVTYTKKTNIAGKTATRNHLIRTIFIIICAILVIGFLGFYIFVVWGGRKKIDTPYQRRRRR